MKTLKMIAVVIGMFLSPFAYFSQAYKQETPVLTDPEIASVAVVANQNDIDFAKISKQRSYSQKVLEFAHTMITDHTSVINLAVDLVTDLSATPKDNAVSRKLKSDAGNKVKILKSKPDAKFDKAYADNGAAHHKIVIEVVKTVLIPHTERGAKGITGEGSPNAGDTPAPYLIGSKGIQ